MEFLHCDNWSLSLNNQLLTIDVTPMFLVKTRIKQILRFDDMWDPLGTFSRHERDEMGTEDL
jgi:hypothetical protein